VAAALLIAIVIFGSLAHNVFLNCVGLYPYLGERNLDSGIADKIFRLVREYSVDGNAICSPVISTNSSVGYVRCKMFSETIVFPRPGGEKLELGFYAGGLRDFRKVWSRTIEATFVLPNNITQGVYRVPGTDTYYFRVAPGLPICLEIKRSEKGPTDVLVLIRVWINGREIRFANSPGITYWIGGVYSYDRRCFDVVWMSFNQLAKGNLEWETYKPLMDMRSSVNITYLVELYVDKPLLSKNMTISITVGPPYIHVHK
jgi:hypothetical protein